MTAISLSREKERGTLEILLVSPLRPWQIIVGKVFPYLARVRERDHGLVAAWLVFNVPFRGSITLLLLESIVYSMVSLAIGVLVASLTPSQRVAMLVALRDDASKHTPVGHGILDRQHADASPGPEQHRPGKMAPSSSPAESCSRESASSIFWRETLVLIGMTSVLRGGRGPKLQGEDRMRVLRALLCKEYLQIYRDKLPAPADDHDAVHPALPVVHCSDIRGQDGEGLRDRPRPEFDVRGLD